MTRLLHNIGPRRNSNYNTAEEIASCRDYLSFDGLYRNVFENRAVLRGRRGILFVMGAYVGRDNAFDAGMPREHYCTWDQIVEVAMQGEFEIGWHTSTHPDLTLVSDAQLAEEVRPPFAMRHFAYPYGVFDARVIAAVKLAGFSQAWAVDKGDDSPFQRRRAYLNW